VIRPPELDQVERLNYPENVTCPQVVRSVRLLCGIWFVNMRRTLANISVFVKNWFANSYSDARFLLPSGY
jgi:hypothetical protein